MERDIPDFLKDLTWVAVDTETSGTNPWKYELLEIGAVRFNVDGEIDNFQVLITPEKKQDPKSKAIHNISSKELKEKGVSLTEAITQFLKFIQDDPLVFHNAPFDMGFLMVAANNCGINIPDNVYYDTLFLSRTYLPGYKSYSLDSFRKELGIDSGPSHRALSDAVATSHLFSHILINNFDKFSSKRKLKTFLRYHRKFSAFEIKIPEDLEKIDNYFKKFVQTNSFIKVMFYDKSNKKIYKTVYPKEILIFNQVLYLKSTTMDNPDPLLIKIQGSIFYDPDLGPLKF